MYWFLLKSILGSVVGSSFYAWFKNTKVGVWFQDKLDTFLEYVADKYHIEIAKREEAWLEQFPNLRDRILQLEALSHPPVSPGGAKDLQSQIDALSALIKK
jgi:hypothetical protein|tara:strand:+ start:41571 stop:41873 length:303 start_codon:yes stop_codon:yes gene_type:complete